MAWVGSTRKARLPPNWATLRARVERRAQGKCEAPVHVPDCTGRGAECDHITQGDDHSMSNLAWLSAACHAAKTRADNHSSKRLTLPTERHPGAL